ncbi:transcriptional regulator [Halobacillus halophilus]|uniref:NprR family transcription regulator n=2 Tax=Halobacillus TaxID=45667 RepID=I0JSR4_HALH3|nr:helix-turn-helix transcriptional regulator [Halobacillus halophilus]ASF41114.1 transcriptional regulator [Halobacillus halophilus]CCG47186.1 NprR family transcription regulator [Halobacillus halophilus DSM 2266]
MKGSLIKQHRKFNNMTLEDLATGICSVSYLSKIEHNTINASEEIYRLLGERLNIKLNDINQDFDEKIYQDLLEWHEAIQLRDLSLMNDYYEKCTISYNKNQNIELLNLYKVIWARHNMKVTEGDLSEEVIKELDDIYMSSSKEFKFFYHKVLGIQCLLMQKLKEALNHFLESNRLMERLPVNDSEVYFHLALTYSQIRSSVESNYFAHKALDGYMNTFNYARTVDTYMIIALNYRYLDIYDLAEEYFLKLLKISKYHLQPIDKRRIHHNLGYVYANQERFEESLHHLEQANQIETIEYFFEVSTIYLLASTYYYYGKMDECWHYMRKGEEKTKKYELPFFQNKFFILRHTIEGTTFKEEFTHKLEHEIIPNLRENNEYGEYKNSLEILGNIFYQKRLYKKSAMCFKEANNFRFTQKKDLL